MNEELFEKYLTNALSPAEQEELKRELEQEKNRRRFVDFLLEWTVTADIARQMALFGEKAPVDAPHRLRGRARAAVPRSGPWRPVWIIGLATAALLLLAVLTQILAGPRDRAVPPAPPEAAARPESPAAIPPEIHPTNPETPPPAPPVPDVRPLPPPGPPGPVPPAPPEAVTPEPSVPPLPGRHGEGPRPSAVAVVQILEARGEATVLKGAERLPAATGQPLVKGSGILTGPGSAVSFAFVDGTRVELGPDTLVREISDGPPGKRIQVSQGSLAADVARQPSGQPAVFQTPLAEAVVLGTRLRLSITAEATKLEVLEGRVRLLRPADKASVEVKAGLQAVARAAGPLAATRPARFVKGINLNGEAVTIEGERWLSHAAALSSGLSISPAPELTATNVQPRPACDEDTARMLNTAVFKGNSNLTVSQEIPNGLYDVYLWVMENLDPDHRSFDIRIEGKGAARDVGARARLGDWAKLGPFRAPVADGSLTIELLQGRSDPHLMGIAIFSAGNP
jgi:ferric-dicitrate binding protein FerR (iron transport regulator)